MRASLTVLEALAKALKLTPAERAHLLRLGRGESLPPLPADREVVSDTLRRLVDSLDFPAYLLGRRFDYLAHNRATRGPVPGAARRPRRRAQPDLARVHASRVAHALHRPGRSRRDGCSRASAPPTPHQVGDPAFEALVERLGEASPEFRDWWPRHEVLGSGEGRKEILHPTAGLLEFEHAVFLHAENSDQRLVLYSPVAGSPTCARMRALMAADAELQPCA